jgi:hypothetical protein
VTEPRVVADLLQEDGGTVTTLEDLERSPAKAVIIAVSHADEPLAALADIRRQLADARPSFILLFVPNRLSPEAVAGHAA